MKRIFIILITLTLALLSGCGNDHKPTIDPNTESSTSSVYKDPTIDYATAEDTERIAYRLIELINEYRTTEGTCTMVKLSGLTEYAKYRSRQLVTNFAHDTFDERAAATALKYGKYVDPSIHGMTGEPYYTANARGAIGKTDLGSNAENIAKHFARLVFNSKGHWSYVGGNDYKYIAVGVTLDNGKWYCCIALSRVNTDEPN